MDPRLLRLYEEELRFLRSAGAEFRDQYPKIAGRLGLETQSCTDPYVERLIEGVAFLGARVQLKLRSRFPEFTTQLLDIVYPHLIAPVPSTGIVAMEPQWEEGALAAGVRIPAHSNVTAPRPRGQATACRYRTAHDVTLWPIKLREAEYMRSPGVLAAHGVPVPNGCRAGLRLAFEVVGGAAVGSLGVRRLPVHIMGADGDDVPIRLYELLHAGTVAVGIRSDFKKPVAVIPDSKVEYVGFSRSEAMLPPCARVFEGYRLLQEYFVLPQRFLYADLPIPLGAVSDQTASEFELFVLFNRADEDLVHETNADRFVLYSTPVVNLFPHTADRIHLEPESTEYHVVPDRNRPMDLEVHSVQRVTGISSTAGVARVFEPMFKTDHLSLVEDDRAFFSVSRQPRIESSARRRRRGSSAYRGTEVYVSLSDPHATHYGTDLRQLELELLCTNRGLALEIGSGPEAGPFTLESGDPVKRVRLLHGPTRPRSALHAAESAWRAISHLSLNYLSLVNSGSGAEPLRMLLGLYVDPSDREAARRVHGLLDVSSEAVVRRMPVRGPLCFGSGLRVRLRFDEEAFVGTGVFLLATVLERFLSKYVSLNSFTETVLETEQRGEVYRWPVRLGGRELS